MLPAFELPLKSCSFHLSLGIFVRRRQLFASSLKDKENPFLEFVHLHKLFGEKLKIFCQMSNVVASQSS